MAVALQEDALTDASDSEAPERGEDDDGDAGEEGSKKKAAKKPVKKAVLKFSLGSAKKGTKADKVRLLGCSRSRDSRFAVVECWLCAVFPDAERETEGTPQPLAPEAGQVSC